MPATYRHSSKLVWHDDRWHLDDRGIHAGEQLELRGYDGQWFAVRVESGDRGRRLIAVIGIHEIDFYCTIDPEYDRLRWPG